MITFDKQFSRGGGSPSLKQMFALGYLKTAKNNIKGGEI